MALTTEEKDVIKLIVLEAIQSYEPKVEEKISDKIDVHIKTCPTKIALDRFKWFMIGMFGSGFASGGAIGAFITSAIKSGAVSYWIDNIKGFFG